MTGVDHWDMQPWQEDFLRRFFDADGKPRSVELVVRRRPDRGERLLTTALMAISTVLHTSPVRTHTVLCVAMKQEDAERDATRLRELIAECVERLGVPANTVDLIEVQASGSGSGSELKGRHP